MMKLKDLYSLTDSIFTDLQSLDVPWKNQNISQKLDIAYMGNQSGNKFISPLVEQFVDNDELSSQDRATIASVVFALNNENWTKLYNTLSLTYDPIENYSMTEVMTNDSTVTNYGKSATRTNDLTHATTGTEQTAYNSTDTRTDNLTHTKAGTETVERAESLNKNEQNTLTKEGTETHTRNNTKVAEGGETRTPNVTTANSVYAFNSSTPSPATISSNNGTETTQFLNRSDSETEIDTTLFDNRVDRTNAVNAETKTENETTSFTDRTDTDAGTSANAKTGHDTLTHNTSETDTGTQTDATSGSDTTTRNYSLTRSGNIGVTTSQQMIESERNLWLWNFFYRVVFPDIDKVLTINIY